jgi:hypothetical protein
VQRFTCNETASLSFAVVPFRREHAASALNLFYPAALADPRASRTASSFADDTCACLAERNLSLSTKARSDGSIAQRSPSMQCLRCFT